MTNHKHKLKKARKTSESEPLHYRFGTGIELIDNNILSGPDIERAVNFKPVADEDK